MSSRTRNEPESSFDHYVKQNPNPSTKQIKHFVSGLNDETKTSSDESVRRSERRPVPKRKADTPVSDVSNQSSARNEEFDSEDEESLEEQSESMEHTSDNDDYTPTASERAKRRRKCAKNYNERHLMQQQVLQSAPSKRKRGRPRTGASNSVGRPPKYPKTAETPNTVKETLDIMNTTTTVENEISIYAKYGSKDYGESVPGEDVRQFVSVLDGLEEVKNASGGFQRFVRTMPDLCCVKLSEFVDQNYDRAAFPAQNDMLQVAQFLRHVWNKFSPDVRKEWEQNARKWLRKEKGNSVVMPPSDFPFTTESRQCSREHDDCCTSEKKDWKRFADVQMHFVSRHKQLVFYACNYCGHLFPTANALTKHCEKDNNCPEFRALLLDLALKSASVEMNHCSFYLTCSDCALWLPISDVNHSEKAPSFGWYFLMKLLEYHSPCSLMIASIYSVKPIEKHEQLDKLPLLLTYTPDLVRDFPMSCEACRDDFNNVAESNTHFKTFHSENVIKCPFSDCSETFGTESHYRLHMQRHLHSNAYLANYIRNRAAVYPPFSAGGLVSMGLTDTPLVGGLLAESSIEINQNKITYHRKLDGDEMSEMLIDQKLKNSQEKTLTLLVDSDNDGEDGNPEGRIDMGVEHLIDYTSHSSKPQIEARAKLNALFSKQATQRLDASCRVNDPEVLLSNLEAGENADKLAKKAKNFGVNIDVDSFVDSILGLATMEARLPTWACSLALDGYLLNRNYWICSQCNSVICHTSDLETHGCDKSEVSELFTVSEKPNSRLHCQICDETVCSLVGLREHYIGKHTTWLTFIDSAIDKGESLTDMTRKSMEITATRKLNASRSDISDFAQKTDKAFGLAPIGCFPRKKVVPPVVPHVTHTPSTYSGVPRRPLRPVEQSRPPKIVQALPSRNQIERPAMRSNRPVVSLAPLNQKMRTNPQRLSPFDDLQTKEGRMVRCKICPVGVRAITVSEIKSHLQEAHSFGCNGCGQHFAQQKNADFHNCCSKLFKDVPHSALVGKCTGCAKSFAMSDLIKHIFNEHTSTVTYGSITGKWYPAFTEISVSDVYMSSVPENELVKKNTHFVYARTRVDPALVSHFPVYKPPTYRQKGGAPNPLDFRSMASLKEVPNSHLCYLCGIDCSSKKDLEDHYSLHNEKFTACPLCSVRIVSHDGMAEHLRAKHYREVFDRSSDTMKLMCNYCSRKVNMVEVSHVLFECPRPPICGLCEDYSTDNPTTMGQHLHKEHRDQVDRFRCSACTQKFYSMFVFATHTCNTEMAPHRCDCGESFPDRQTFSRHFMNKHMEPVELHCNLCTFESGRLLSNAINHRTAHCRLTVTQAQRRCIVLDRKLYKKSEDVILKGKVLMPLKPKPTPVLSEEDDIEIIEVQKAKTTIINKTNNGIPTSPAVKPEVCVISTGGLIKNLVGDLISVIEDAEKAEAVDWDKLEYGGISPLVSNSPAAASSRPGSADLFATVRTEDDAGTSSCVAQFHYDPTGDGDDDIECIQIAQASTHPEALITAIDDEGDDELQVLATVQNPPGTLSSSLSSRSAKFKCCQCSATFLTKASVEAHTLNQHQSDAGGILDEAYGMPKSDKPVFICRCCCVAFETVVQQQEHMIRHRSSKALSCKECSAFAYNSALDNNHKEAHNKPISYCCSECQFQFKKESRLYYHLQKHHDIPLLFFCKECGLGSQDIDVIHRHLQISRKCEKALNSMNFDVRQHGYGICPASLLHYQPVDVKTYAAEVATRKIQIVPPSDCTHRSFLAPTSSVICCRECFCLKNMQQFLAEQAVGFGADTPYYSKNVDERLDCPFAPGIMRPNYRTGEIQPNPQYRYSIPVSAVRDMSHEQWKNPQPNLYTQRNNRPTTSQPVLPQMLNRILPRNAGLAAAVYGVQNPGSPRLIPTAMPKQMQNGGLNYTLRQPNAEHHPAARIQVFSNRLRATASNIPAMRMTLSGGHLVNGMNSAQNVITIDEEAPAARAMARRKQEIIANTKRPIERYTEAKKDKRFFCADCHIGFESEKRAIEHMYIRHCNVANLGNRSVIFSLECPFQCTTSRYSTITAYRQHLATAHVNDATHRSEYCAITFVDKNCYKKHCNSHEKYEEEHGIMPRCCELCGDVDNWTDKVGPVNISHMAIHGCDLNLACRDCDFAPGPSCPNQLDVLLAHFIKRHAINVSPDGSYCRICNGRSTLSSEEMRQHFINIHMMTIFRPVLAAIGDRAAGEIKLPLVKTSTATQKFLGLPVEKEWNIDEIVENDLHVYRVICKDRQL